MPQVNFRRPELLKRMRQYTLIRDAIEGEMAVKAKGRRYLRPPWPVKTAEDTEDFEAYLERAVFYNATGRTLRGYVGQVFSRLPEITVPDYLQATVADMNGLGVNAVQQAKALVGDTTALGRAGLLSDFPSVPEGREVTAADVISGEIKPIIARYEPEQIINWRTSSDGSTRKLLLVVLEEKREEYLPGDFSFTEKKQWRVLRIDESGFYRQELYYDNNSTPTVYNITDYAGERLDYIPFEFIGSEDNDPTLDDAPMYSLASLNISHFRNSADLENSGVLVGQPTIAMSGLTQDWVKNVFEGKPVRFGSKHVIPLPQGASLELVQADPNNLVREMMQDKERQMVALGAQLVEQRRVQRTATEVNQDESAEASVLMTVADNASVAYAQAFASAARFVSGDDPNILFKLNTSFDTALIDAATRMETIKEWQSGAITWEEMRGVLRRAGVATLPDDIAKAKTLEEEKARAALMEDLYPTNVNNPDDPGATGASN